MLNLLLSMTTDAQSVIEQQLLLDKPGATTPVPTAPSSDGTLICEGVRIASTGTLDRIVNAVQVAWLQSEADRAELGLAWTQLCLLLGPRYDALRAQLQASP